MEKSRTQQVFSEMIRIIKESDGMIRHNKIELKLKDLEEYKEEKITQDHINGAFNYLRKHYKEYNIDYKRISTQSYFEYLNTNQEIGNNIEIKDEVNLKGKSLIDELNNMKKAITEESDFSTIQNIINKLNSIFK